MSWKDRLYTAALWATAMLCINIILAKLLADQLGILIGFDITGILWSWIRLVVGFYILFFIYDFLKGMFKKKPKAG